MDTNNTNNTIEVTFFDIAKKNFAYYTESFDFQEVFSIRKKYGLQKRILFDSNFQKEIFTTGKRKAVGVVDLRINDSPFLDMNTRRNIVKFLDVKMDLWKNSNLIVIEQQYFSKQRRNVQANMDAIKISELVSTWFLSVYPSKQVMFFPSVNKTKYCGAPKKLDDRSRKQFAIEKAKEISELRNDECLVSVFDLKQKVAGKRKRQMYYTSFCENVSDTFCIELAKGVCDNLQKLDDWSDCICMAAAFKILYSIQK